MRSARLAALVLLVACSPASPTETKLPTANDPKTPAASSTAPTFDDDVAFLRKYGSVTVLESPAGGRAALSAKYQGRVMTSATRAGGPSLGWIHRDFIAAARTRTPFDNYGGEDRFWLGPEGGQFALYFPPGKPFEFALWQTPAALQEGEWTVTESTPTGVTFTRAMKLVNWSGTAFELSVERTVHLVAAEPLLAGAPRARWIAYESVNKITNTGKNAWTRDSGLLSIWILGMFQPAPDARIVVPFNKASGDVVNDRYFGKVPSDRLRIDDATSCITFTADGKHRSKIGLSAARATGALGSYSASARVLTLVRLAQPSATSDYVDNMWEKRADPFKGDAINAYNDGPTEPGKASLGGFYELETSSPAAALKPGESLVHTHATLHVEVDDAVRDAIAKSAFPIPARCLF
jgi:hypothetical protein